VKSCQSIFARKEQFCWKN